MCIGVHHSLRDRLTIKAFYIHLSISLEENCIYYGGVDSLTLHFPPRITGRPLAIDGSNVPPHSPAFVTLHRDVSPEAETLTGLLGGAIFGSRKNVSASEGVRFEVFYGDSKLLKGWFTRCDDGEDLWKMDCKCDKLSASGVMQAEVCVAAEGQAALLSVKVEMEAEKRKKNKAITFQELEDIPEVREADVDGDDDECRCGEVERERGSEEKETEESAGMEEVMGWAVDVGIWVVCLGVAAGYLVSKAAASSSSIRPLRRPTSRHSCGGLIIP